MAEEAGQKASRKNELLRQPELGITESPLIIVVQTLLLHEIHGDSAPVSLEIV
jgi:hypothetical protein